MAYTVITKPSVGAQVSKSAFGDLTVDNFAYLYNLRTKCVEMFINGDSALTTSDKGYYTIPSTLSAGTIIGVSAKCLGASSSGGVTATLTNTTTGNNVLSTNITLDQTKTSSLTSTTQPVVNNTYATVSTDDDLVVAITGAGSGVTRLRVLVYINPSA